MQRISCIAVSLAAVLLIPPAFAQTPPPSRPHSLTPQQHQEVKAKNVKFTACHNKALAAKVAPKDRRAHMKSCLAGQS
jgi:hypothetical protein